MSVNPYLMWICGIEGTKPNDPRFDIEARRKMAQSDMGEFYIGELELPFVPDDSLGEIDENFDLLTGRYKEHYIAKQVKDLFYEGNPASNYAWSGISDSIGYIIAGNSDDDLLRGLAIIPGFKELFSSMYGGYVVLPQLDIDKNKMRYRDNCQSRPGGKPATDLAIKEGRWINMYQPWETDLWFRRALWLFHFTGWTGVTRDMLKLMMVFDWA